MILLQYPSSDTDTSACFRKTKLIFKVAFYKYTLLQRAMIAEAKIGLQWYGLGFELASFCFRRGLGLVDRWLRLRKISENETLTAGEVGSILLLPFAFDSASKY